MLRDFGIVTVVDLTVSLLGVLAVLPSVLVLAERGVLLRRIARLGGPPRRRTPSARAREPARPRRSRERPRRRGSRSSRDSRSSPTSRTTRSRRRPTSSTGLAAGARMPPFAAPLVTSDLVGDANVAGRARPGPGRRAAGVLRDRPARAQQLHARAPRPGRARVLHRRRRPLHRRARRDGAGRAAPSAASRFAAVAIRGDRGDLRTARAPSTAGASRSRRTATARSRTSTGSRSARPSCSRYRGGVVLRTALGSDADDAGGARAGSAAAGAAATGA